MARIYLRSTAFSPILASVPTPVTDLETALSRYVHPDFRFYDVMNEVLPRLASKGLWRDMTLQVSQTLQSDQYVHAVPDVAEAPLFCLHNNSIAPVRGLWHDYIALGATGNNPGPEFGFIDAGFGPTKELLASTSTYSIYAIVAHDWREFIDANDELHTLPPDFPTFTGNERVKITYVNYLGITESTNDLFSAIVGGHAFEPYCLRLSPGGVREIVSIEYEDITVPISLIAVPIRVAGSSAFDGNTNLLMTNEDFTPLPFNSTTDFNDSTFDDALVYGITVNALVPRTGAGVAALINSVDEDNVDCDVADLGDAFADTIVEFVHPAHLRTTFYSTVPCEYNSDAALVNGTVTADTDNREIARIERGWGFTRYRHFRTGASGLNLHTLYKRKQPKLTEPSDLVYLSNIAAIKFAIMAHAAEFESDMKAANAYWKQAKDVLDQELTDSLGSAKPVVQFEPFGGQLSTPAIQ